MKYYDFQIKASTPTLKPIPMMDGSWKNDFTMRSEHCMQLPLKGIGLCCRCSSLMSSYMVCW